MKPYREEYIFGQFTTTLRVSLTPDRTAVAITIENDQQTVKYVMVPNEWNALRNSIYFNFDGDKE